MRWSRAMIEMPTEVHALPSREDDDCPPALHSHAALLMPALDFDCHPSRCQLVPVIILPMETTVVFN